MAAGRRIPIVLVLFLAACAAVPPGDGSDLYARLTDADVARASRAVQVALETLPEDSGLDWVNPATGAAGRVTPRTTFIRADGVFCRRYEERLRVAGREGRVENVACRDREGRWIWVG